MSTFNQGDICEIVGINEKDRYFGKRNFLIGKKVRIICTVSQLSLKDDGLFSGWVEIPGGAPEIKIEKGGFTYFTHAELKKIEP